MTKILFVCNKNAGKSQMAAGLLEKLITDDPVTGVEVASAGTNAGTTVNPESVEVLAEQGIDIAGREPQQLTDDLQREAALVVVLGSQANPEQVDGPRYLTWITDEPAERGIEGLERMRLIRDDIAERVADLHTGLAADLN